MSILTTILKLRRPSADGSDAANLHTIIGNLADDVDAAAAPAYTTAQLGALPAAQRPVGRYVYDTSTGEGKIANGAGFTPLASQAYAASVVSQSMPAFQEWTPVLSTSAVSNMGTYVARGRWSRIGKRIQGWASAQWVTALTANSSTDRMYFPVPVAMAGDNNDIGCPWVVGEVWFHRGLGPTMLQMSERMSLYKVSWNSAIDCVARAHSQKPDDIQGVQSSPFSTANYQALYGGLFGDKPAVTWTFDYETF